MNKHKIESCERGFSLIELLMTIVIMTIATGAIFSLLNQSLKTSSVSNQMADAQQSLRTSQEYVSRDLYNVGDNLVGLKPLARAGFVTAYLSSNLVTTTITPQGFALTGMILSDNRAPGVVPVTNPPASQPALLTSATADRLTLLTTPDPGNAFPDIESDNTQQPPTNAPLTNNAATNQMYVLTTSLTNPSGAPTVVAGEIYLLINSGASGGDKSCVFVTVTGTATLSSGRSAITFGSAGDYGLNSQAVSVLTSGNTNPLPTATPLTLRRVWIVHYFVDELNRLTRRVFGQRDTTTGLPFTESIIAENVTKFQLNYILRRITTNSDGTTTIQAPEAVDQLSTGNELDWVRQVKISLTTKTDRPVINNQPQEISTSTIISPRNLQFRGAQQP